MYNLIFKRRSVRFFKDRDISKVDMREILRAGMWAPSAKNRQPWKFIVVKGESKKTALALMEKGIERSEKAKASWPVPQSSTPTPASPCSACSRLRYWYL